MKTGAPAGRDDTTAWKSKDGSTWRMGYGTANGNQGYIIIYTSKDFLHWTKGLEYFWRFFLEFFFFDTFSD